MPHHPGQAEAVGARAKNPQARSRRSRLREGDSSHFRRGRGDERMSMATHMRTSTMNREAGYRAKLGRFRLAVASDDRGQAGGLA